MSVFASCGHKVEDMDDLVHIEFDDEDIDHDAGCFVPVVVTGLYCPKCATEGLAAGRYRRPQS